MSCKVVDLRTDRFDVYIGRGSKWGNPFIIGRDGSRNDVIRKYKDWISRQADLLECLDELRGKVLGCYCYPRACHGDILVALVQDLPPLEAQAAEAAEPLSGGGERPGES